MNWITNIATQLVSRGKKYFYGATMTSYIGWDGITKHAFADAVFLNMVELLTDLTNDVTWVFDGNGMKEAAFKRFFATYGQIVMNRIYTDGFVVVKHSVTGEGENAAHEYAIALPDDFSKSTENGWEEFKPLKAGYDIYVLRSPLYASTGKSDKQIVTPFLEFLDNTLNASNTASARMGAMVVCSPKNPSNAPMPVVMGEEEKKKIEEQMGNEYGALHSQKQVMVLPREMSWQVVSLASLDLKTIDKVKMAVTAIADRIKVPANQVSLIDANSSKSLSNGTELREGDISKYKSFERIFDSTWVQFAKDCGLRPGMSEVVQGQVQRTYYTIYNKPKQQTNAV